MKVNKLKIIGMVGAVALIFASCGKSNATTDPRAAAPATSGTCDASATGDFIYTGDIEDCSASTNGCMPGQASVTGSVKLTIIPTGGQMGGQFTASALLTVNGSSFCCTSQGASGILGGANGLNNVEATVSSLPLVCQGTTGTTGGLFSGGYNNMAIKIGVPNPDSIWGDYSYPVGLLTTDKRLEAFVEIVSGNQVIGNFNNRPFFVY